MVDARSMTPEEIEWQRMKRSRPSSMKPLLFAVALSALLGGGAFAGVYAFGEHSARENARMEAAGYHLECVHVGSGNATSGPCDPQGLGALALIGVAIAALAGFAGGFKLGGGKIAPEYLRGASRM